MIALTASTVLTPLERIEDAVVVMDGGRIADVGPRSAVAIPNRARVLDLGDCILTPGLVDLHIHGGAGHDVMETGADALPCIEHLLFQHGITAYLPTTVSAPVDFTLCALERLANAIESKDHPAERARPIGIHLEGPFLSHARRGVHKLENLQKPTLALFDRLWQAARGHVKVMTIAPELDGAVEVIEEASRRGVCISLGHTDADAAQTQAAIRVGARHVTHTFNAMRPLSHRDPGILDVALTDDRLTAEIIVDGIHVDPMVVKLFMRAKGSERAVLVTDGLAATGMPNGHYRLGELDFEVQDGRCFTGDTLAGSVLTLDRAVTNTMDFAGVDFQQALRAATLNPANTAGLSCGRGRIAAGAAADLAVFSRQYQPVRTIVAGEGI